jgi:putative endonuclease
MMHYVYLLQNLADKDDYYLGCTSDLKKRVVTHNEGKNIATKNRQWKLVYYEAYLTLSAARKREYHLKQEGRAKRFLLERVKESLK